MSMRRYFEPRRVGNGLAARERFHGFEMDPDQALGPLEAWEVGDVLEGLEEQVAQVRERRD